LVLNWALDIHVLCQPFDVPNLVQVVECHLTIVSVQNHAFNLLANEFHGIGVELVASLCQRVNGSAKLCGFT
jgi:hypothetical protein